MKAFREILAAAGLLFAILTAIYGCFTLPQRFPTHFDANNIADGWSGKSSLLFPVAIACVIYVAMTLARYLPESSMNYPFDPKQRASARPISLAAVAWLKAEIIWIFAASAWFMVAEARGQNPDLELWFIPLALVIVFATVIYHIVLTVRLGKATGDTL
jgi:uncharacterized membrane protein